jgi:hypothetical protein
VRVVTRARRRSRARQPEIGGGHGALRGVRIRQEDRELVATNPRHRVRFTHVFLESSRDRLQLPVAGAVAQLVV